MNLKQRAAAAVAVAAMTALILDSSCASRSALTALELCIKTLIPNLFPLLVLSTLLVPRLSDLRLPILSKLLGIPNGSEGLFLLGCVGGYPVGAASIAQAVDAGLSKKTAQTMLGICTLCSPAFLFGVLGPILSLKEALLIFLIQLETAFLVAAFRTPTTETYHPIQTAVDLPTAIRRATSSMSTICAWVLLAGVAAGFLDRWLFPLLPTPLAVTLTGLLELTNGVFSLGPLTPDLQFMLATVFVCFGGVSVLLQIAGLTNLPMAPWIAQKTAQALLGALLAALDLRFGPPALLLPPALLFAKMTLEIPARMVYNSRRKEGI